MVSFSILLRIMVIHQNVKSVQCALFPAESDVSWYPAESADETKLPAKWPRKKERARRRGERWEKSPWRTAPLFRFSPALPSSTFYLFLLSQSLTGFFRQAHVSDSGSIAQKPAITENRHGEERELKIPSRSSDDGTFYPSHVFRIWFEMQLRAWADNDQA